MRHLCQIYKTRPEWCVNYPWSVSYNESDYHDDCQFYDPKKRELVSADEVLKEKSQKELEEYCVECGKCCFYWYGGQQLHPCSALQIVDGRGIVVRESQPVNEIPEDQQWGFGEKSQIGSTRQSKD